MVLPSGRKTHIRWSARLISMPSRGPSGRMWALGRTISLSAPGTQGSMPGFAETISVYPKPWARARSTSESSYRVL